MQRRSYGLLEVAGRSRAMGYRTRLTQGERFLSVENERTGKRLLLAESDVGRMPAESVLRWVVSSLGEPERAHRAKR